MKIVINHRDKYIRKELIRMCSDRYPNSDATSYEDPLMAAKSAFMGSGDVVIFGLSGIKLIPMLKNHDEHVRIIILAENAGHRDEAYSAGADGYITMPIREEELFSAVEGTSELF
ncbi:MAG: response regulator [Lachnospiraceae bacterium]|nr:response regulator [Lachnospiraceae bacterium]